MLKSASLIALVLPLFLCTSELRAQNSEQDVLKLRDVVTLNIPDPSGLSLHSETGFLWTLSDVSGGNITLITESGQRVSTLPYPGDDMEGISYDAVSNSLWITEEREQELRRLNLQGEVLETVSVDIGQANSNNGPEGIAVNPANGHLFVANQENPRVLLELNNAREIISERPVDFEPPYDINNMSGLFYDELQEEFWILSAGSQKIVVTDTALEPLRRYLLDIEAPEGIAVDTQRDLVFVVSDADNQLYIYERLALMNPPAHQLIHGDYLFDFWSAEEPDFSYPAHMSFQMSNMDDPRLTDEPDAPYYVPYDDYNPEDEATIGFPYNNTRRTRINGLGENGISMINTGRGRDLGAVVLALNTSGADQIFIDWEAETLERNSRVYAYRLQYRSSADAAFTDLLQDDEPVEYKRGPFNGHQQFFENIPLPSDALNQPYVQLRWKFYYTGEQTGGGGRDELRLDNIRVRSGSSTSVGSNDLLQPAVLLQNYPNPFNPSTRISYILEKSSGIELDVFTLGGRHVIRLDEGHRPPGRYSFNFDAGLLSLSSGMYVYRIVIDGKALPVKQMMLIR